MPKNEGTKGQLVGKNLSGGANVVPPEKDQTPTLSELGLDKKTSKLAQDIASLPDEELEKVKRGLASLSKAQDLASALLDAEVRIGQLLKDLPKEPGKRTDLQPTKYQAIQKLGFHQKQAERFETLAEHPDIVEQALVRNPQYLRGLLPLISSQGLRKG